MKIQPKKPFISGLVEGNIDPKVYQDVLKTHAKETIAFIDYGNLSITNVSPKAIERVQFTECEISPFRQHEYSCDDVTDNDIMRHPSLSCFSNKPLAFEKMKTLLVQAFSPDAQGRRPYPSAGGLYPVEPLVFLFAERLRGENLPPSGCYHFRPVSRQLQLIKTIPSAQFIERLMHGFITTEQAPCFVVLYVAHLGKSIFKYRYRGYRHALMEAGSMYQQAMHVAESMSLRNTVWSTFSEHQVLYEIGLDYGTYLPLTMQFFGYGDAS